VDRIGRASPRLANETLRCSGPSEGIAPRHEGQAAICLNRQSGQILFFRVEETLVIRIFGSALSSLLLGALLTGCGAPPSQVGAVSSIPQTEAEGSAIARTHSWMASDAKTASLLYVSSVLTNDVYVYSYSTHKLMGTLTGFETPYGLCVDKAANVWIVNDGASQIAEYAHGGTTPIATLSDPGEYPEGCSVDPTTGNLAVTNFYSGSGAGSVSIYAGAQGSLKLYSDPAFTNYRFCGYDAHGNLLSMERTAARRSRSPSLRSEARPSRTFRSTRRSSGPAACNGMANTLPSAIPIRG